MPQAIYSAAIVGTQGHLVSIEGSKQNANPAIMITGLPGDIVKEGREKIRGCLQNFGFDIPSTKLLLHLFPAEAPKKGSHFDLSMALKVLDIEGQLSLAEVKGLACLGELSLDGKIHAVKCIIPLLECLERDPEIQTVIIPDGNAREAGLICSQKARVARNLMDIVNAIRNHDLDSLPPVDDHSRTDAAEPHGLTIDDVLGQAMAKRALVIALCGHHHLLMMGPPGVGKTLLAMAAPSLLPPLQETEIVEVLRIHSLAGLERSEVSRPPFRSPHHSVTPAGCLGGGSGQIMPGDVSLAHRGILFLDELPEYRRDVVEGLREPLQNGTIHVHRLGHSWEVPSRFQLLAAMNPCPCGLALNEKARCLCPPEKIRAYRRRVSAAILDRIDLFAWFTPSHASSSGASNLSYEEAKKLIARVRTELRPVPALRERLANLQREEKSWVEELIGSGQSSFRGIEKVLSVAETLRRIDEASEIRMPHLLEAWALRCPRYFHS